MYGYHGKLLFVNLSTGAMEERELDEKTAREYIGGPALGAKILFDNMPAKADPFGEESMIGFLTGPLNGSSAFFGGRYTVVSKSPVTGGFNDANSGGHFGPKLKAAGFDAIFVNGISPKPVYIFVQDGKAEIKDASALWGLTTTEAEAKLKEEYGGKVGAALISPAGERKSLISCVMNDEHRAAGRGGSGAVMGSKQLKAIVALGSAKTPVADKEKLVAVNREISKSMSPDNPFTAGMGMFGTGAMTANSVLVGDAGVKNWAGSCVDFPEEKAAAISSPALQKYVTKKYHCDSCPMGCGALMDLPMEDGSVMHTARPEYETMGAFGSMCLNGNGESVMRCNQICNEYGLDVISAGDTVAWVLECYDKGILTADELDGIEAKWGDADAIEALAWKIAKGDGVGAILQNGTRAAAAAFGKGEECVVTANGIELPMHDSRLAYGLARTYKYDPTPGRHVKGGIGMMPSGPDFDYENSAAADIAGIVSTEFTNATGSCLLGGMAVGPNLLPLVCAVTGWDMDEKELSTFSLRSYTIRHAFNLREGWTRASAQLSERMLRSKPPFDGPLADREVDVEKLADNLFAALDWDKETLRPSDKALADLDLSFVAEQI